jgi:hypothetical protein
VKQVEHLRTRKEYLKDKINELETNNTTKIKEICTEE